ncbi:MAG: GNAT family N-acetyltransferase [Deltaproteobacteria bacterium]|jgi:RimJ/RimL family protein N-acetyltransferase|nr:GNAT family N-acetyltransferase [Deltaproteobacteria bacterium]
MKLPIETERLLLRKYEDRDLQDILDYSSDPDYWLSRTLDWPVTEEGVKTYWEAQREIDPGTDPEWFCLAVELKSKRKVIGQVGIGVVGTGDERQGTIGWLLGTEFQGQGLATEAAGALMTAAFKELRLHRITAQTGRDNVRSWYLMERLGMRREAHFVKSHMIRGRWRDEFVYAVLADEWQAIQRRRLRQLRHRPTKE